MRVAGLSVPQTQEVLPNRFSCPFAKKIDNHTSVTYTCQDDGTWDVNNGNVGDALTCVGTEKMF